MRSFRLDCTEFDTFSDRGARPRSRTKEETNELENDTRDYRGCVYGIIAGAAQLYLSSGAADAAPALKVENKALVDAINGAQTD